MNIEIENNASFVLPSPPNGSSSPIKSGNDEYDNDDIVLSAFKRRGKVLQSKNKRVKKEFGKIYSYHPQVNNIISFSVAHKNSPWEKISTANNFLDKLNKKIVGSKSAMSTSELAMKRKFPKNIQNVVDQVKKEHIKEAKSNIKESVWKPKKKKTLADLVSILEADSDNDSQDDFDYDDFDYDGFDDDGFDDDFDPDFIEETPLTRGEEKATKQDSKPILVEKKDEFPVAPSPENNEKTAPSAVKKHNFFQKDEIEHPEESIEKYINEISNIKAGGFRDKNELLQSLYRFDEIGHQMNTIVFDLMDKPGYEPGGKKYENLKKKTDEYLLYLEKLTDAQYHYDYLRHVFLTEIEENEEKKKKMKKITERFVMRKALAFIGEQLYQGIDPKNYKDAQLIEINNIKKEFLTAKSPNDTQHKNLLMQLLKKIPDFANYLPKGFLDSLPDKQYDDLMNHWEEKEEKEQELKTHKTPIHSDSESDAPTTPFLEQIRKGRKLKKIEKKSDTNLFSSLREKLKKEKVEKEQELKTSKTSLHSDSDNDAPVSSNDAQTSSLQEQISKGVKLKNVKERVLTPKKEPEKEINTMLANRIASNRYKSRDSDNESDDDWEGDKEEKKLEKKKKEQEEKKRKEERMQKILQLAREEEERREREYIKEKEVEEEKKRRAEEARKKIKEEAEKIKDTQSQKKENMEKIDRLRELSIRQEEKNIKKINSDDDDSEEIDEFDEEASKKKEEKIKKKELQRLNAIREKREEEERLKKAELKMKNKANEKKRKETERKIEEQNEKDAKKQFEYLKSKNFYGEGDFEKFYSIRNKIVDNQLDFSKFEEEEIEFIKEVMESKDSDEIFKFFASNGKKSFKNLPKNIDDFDEEKVKKKQEEEELKKSSVNEYPLERFERFKRIKIFNSNKTFKEFLKLDNDITYTNFDYDEFKPKTKKFIDSLIVGGKNEKYKEFFEVYGGIDIFSNLPDRVDLI